MASSRYSASRLLLRCEHGLFGMSTRVVSCNSCTDLTPSLDRAHQYACLEETRHQITMCRTTLEIWLMAATRTNLHPAYVQSIKLDLLPSTSGRRSHHVIAIQQKWMSELRLSRRARVEIYSLMHGRMASPLMEVSSVC